MDEVLAMTKTSYRKSFSCHLKHRITSLTILVIVALASQVQVVNAQPTDRPNIVLIMADDLGFSDLGCYGSEIDTPNLDRLAKDGLRFLQFYNASRCCPSRAALLTGKYPHEVGLRNNGASLSKNVPTLAEILRDNGYHTAMAGKWHLTHAAALAGKGVDSPEHLAVLNNQTQVELFGERATYPAARGFQKHFGVIWGIVNYFHPFALVDGFTPVYDLPDDFYLTDALNATTADYIREFAKHDKPFFIYLAHTAPHWPLHARAKDRAKYKGRYDDGWEVMRKQRYARQIEMGLIDPDIYPLPPIDLGRRKGWDEMTDEQRARDAAKMETHAAMIDRMDQGLGDVIKALKDTNQFDNTIIIFLSDNGASPEEPTHAGYDRPSETPDGRTIRYTGRFPPDELGRDDTWTGLGPALANACNTPFRYWKKESYHGGCATPFFVHWPAGLKAKAGTTTDQVAHVFDLMPTVLDTARIDADPYKPRGKSLLPTLQGKKAKGHEKLFFEHVGGAAHRDGDWKIVRMKPKERWALYDLSKDRTETRDLARDNSERINAMAVAWTAWWTEVTEAKPDVSLNTEDLDDECQIEFVQRDSKIEVTWPTAHDRRARLTFDLAEDQPLIESIAVSGRSEKPFEMIANSLDPVVLVRVGKRDLDKRGGWTIFFDRMQEKPNEVFNARIERTRAVASGRASRAVLTIGDVTAGPFRGELRWTFYAGSPFVLQEAVVQTEKNGLAFLYDAGLVCRKEVPKTISWRDPLGEPKTASPPSIEKAKPLAVGGRTICAEFKRGCVAVFPPPHRYFYPLDFSDNLANGWIGPEYDEQPLSFGFGIRHDPRGDNRFVPWFNAPPGTSQQLGMFLFVSGGSAEETLEDIARLTRNDRFAPLPGFKVFSSHYHVEHTQEILNAQAAEKEVDSDILVKSPSGEEYRVHARLQNPGFRRVFREQGIDIVHLAEFHFGKTPRMKTDERLRYLELLHSECKRLSNDEFLLLPGEEPNVHLGGHWISFFPKPVYWVLNRPDETPFVSDHPKFGKVYHVGGEADVLRLLKEEGGLAWTAHPRIKGSTGFPDNYRQRLFFTSDRFLGAAWKAMPADLSQPRLGSRVLDLLNDMSNWGDPKYVVGEVDVFKIEPDHELYGHMNVNYLRLEKIPRFEDGWQPVLDALRGGQFFVTTGEVLIPEFTVNGKRSGELTVLPKDGKSKVRLDLKWTFPLAYAEIISGDARNIKRQRIDLSETTAFGEDSLTVDSDLSGQRWVRLEVWDIATNGAFTQPVWLESR